MIIPLTYGYLTMTRSDGIRSLFSADTAPWMSVSTHGWHRWDGPKKHGHLIEQPTDELDQVQPTYSWYLVVG